MRLLTRALLVTVSSVGALVGGLPAVASADAPEPESSIKSTWNDLQDVLSNGNATCEDLAPYTMHSAYRVDPADPDRNVLPDEPPTEEECNNIEAFAPTLEATKGKKFKEFGTGALVEGTARGVAAGRKAVVFFVLDQDDQWKAILAEDIRRQIGTKLNGAKFGRVVNGFVESIRDDDCEQTFIFLSDISNFTASGDVNEVCTGLRSSIETGSGKSFDIQESTDKPERLGGTRDVGFYGLEIDNGRYVTFVLIATGGAGDDHSDPGVYEFLTTRPPNDEA
jgi:hypothetical protein